MTPSQLADLLLSPLTKRHMVFMMERMSGAMAYHRYRLSPLLLSVADLDPDPPDPHVFGPPISGSGSGSESFYHHAKIVRKTLIPTIL